MLLPEDGWDESCRSVSKAQNAVRYLTIVNHILGKEWLSPHYFRIGASQLMDDLTKEIKALENN